MIVLLVLVVGVVWVVTVRDVVRRGDLRVGRRVTWVLATLLLPILAAPAYWLVKPQRRSPAAPPPATAGHAQTLADLIPGWSPDLPGACDQANAWAGSGSRVAPEPSFYSWLRESGIAERYPACATKLLRTLLGTERRSSFPACPQIGALTSLLDQYLMDGDDLRAVKEQVRRLCPGMPVPDHKGAGRSVHPALG
jgi:hypothetical protein